MRIRKVLALTVGVAVAGLLIAIFFSSRSERQPPVVGLVSVEPAGIFDEAGEMSLVTLCISNAEPRSNSPIFVKESARPFEAKLTNRWIDVDGAMGTFCLYGQQRHEQQLLVSEMTECCRANLKWSCPRLTKGGLAWIAEQLPRSKTSLEVWRWAVRHGGYPQYGPSTRWQNLTVELPLDKIRLVANASAPAKR